MMLKILRKNKKNHPTFKQLNNQKLNKTPIFVPKLVDSLQSAICGELNTEN